MLGVNAGDSCEYKGFMKFQHIQFVCPRTRHTIYFFFYYYYYYYYYCRGR